MSARVSVPQPGPTSTIKSLDVTFAHKIECSTTRGSTKKFCPNFLLGQTHKSDKIDFV